MRLNNINPPILIFLFKTVWLCKAICISIYIFWSAYQFLQKIVCWDFDKNCIELSQFWGNCHLNNNKSSNSWTLMCIYLNLLSFPSAIFCCSQCIYLALSSVQFSRSVMSDSLRPHEPQHTRPSCSSPTPKVYPNPCPSSQWYHPTISSSVISFSSCPQSFPASGSFQMSQLFSSSGQSIGVSASTSVLLILFYNNYKYNITFKYWMLYIWNLYNTVNQLYLNMKSI